MISKSPNDREIYESRLKLQRDEQSRLQAAEARGEEALGEARGRVRMLEGLLGLDSPANFDSLTVEDLATRELLLQRQLRERGIG